MSEAKVSGRDGCSDGVKSSGEEHDQHWFGFHVDSPGSDASDQPGDKPIMTPVNEWNRIMPHTPPNPRSRNNESRTSASSPFMGVETDLGVHHEDLNGLLLTNALAATDDEDEVSVLTSSQEV